MENLINYYANMKQCFDKYSLEDINNMNDDQIKNLCVQEKIQFMHHFNNLKTVDIIEERLDIKQSKLNQKANEMRMFYDSTLFKN